jgi:hypothetical protein
VPTTKQELGDRGEKAVAKHVPCPRCNRPKHLVKLTQNFPCADVICKFCGFLAQVKATRIKEGDTGPPSRIPGAAWGPQQDRIIAGVYHDLFIASFSPKGRLMRIDHVPGHILQVTPEVFEPRKNPLSPTAKRAGWLGFDYNIEKLPVIGIRQVYPS